MTQRPRRRLRLATYNIHRSIGGDRRHDPSRVATVLREIDADLIALQEVSTRSGGPDDLDQLRFLADATGLSPIAGPTLTTERGHVGNAILTRLPVGAVRPVDLSRRGREPRAAIDADLVLGSGTGLRVVATHLGLRRRERMVQLRALRDLVAGDSSLPTAILGDLNEWLRPGDTARQLAGGFGGARVRTFPATRPALALDRILVRPAELLLRTQAHRSAAATLASDHLPLWAELAWPPG